MHNDSKYAQFKNGATDSVTVLEMHGVSKYFDGVRALADVDFSVKAGEVHALVGENGAGKSTLMKCLLGTERMDSGVVSFVGEQVNITKPAEALKLGISMIHQELRLVPTLNVAQNIWLGREDRFARQAVLSDQAMIKATRKLLQELSFPLEADVLVANLTVAQMQLVEIARAVSYDARLIIMDEPTSALTPSEITLLYDTIEMLTARGTSVVFISHKLDEIYRVSERITVLRDGVLLGTFDTPDLSAQELVNLIAGRELQAVRRDRSSDPGDEKRLEVIGLTSEGVFHDVHFSVGAGEIVGFFGLMGAGRTEIMRAIYGLDSYSSGVVKLDSRAAKFRSPRHAVKAGMGMITEDRLRSGSIFTFSVLYNSTLAATSFFRNTLGWMRRRQERLSFSRLAADLHIKASSPSALIGSLSGGNQQKVLISRWLHNRPRVLILDEPTRGVDVGAKVEIYQIVHELAQMGLAIIVVSSEIPEILSLADRCIVVRDGRIVHEEQTETITNTTILQHAFGTSRSEVAAVSEGV